MPVENQSISLEIMPSKSCPSSALKHPLNSRISPRLRSAACKVQLRRVFWCRVQEERWRINISRLSRIYGYRLTVLAQTHCNVHVPQPMADNPCKGGNTPRDGFLLACARSAEPVAPLFGCCDRVSTSSTNCSSTRGGARLARGCAEEPRSRHGQSCHPPLAAPWRVAQGPIAPARASAGGRDLLAQTWDASRSVSHSKCNSGGNFRQIKSRWSI